ncbi:DMT family transporter [Parapusillimonas granuli]|uniref:DMT family transporter n=1 Tax=Parapusillimonas granuli TaxID=380911 RepID=A0A853FPV1_9BURK|nr:DMT family transporter [Parapusillimonas granuli]MBB5216094.1 drug/metabolite transporter (DMT)-like permease [Parapusillimonas granuli]NYT47775.1 DMT family transporter [Parapusillimonas granuli]
MNPVSMQVLLIGVMAIWGVNISAVKVLTTQLDPLLVACLRMVLAVAVINLTLFLARQPLKLRGITRKQWLRFLLCALLMVYGNQVLFTAGMRSASATNAALISALSPLMASLLVAAMFRETLTRRRLVGIVIGFGGVAAVVLNRSGAAVEGAGWGDLQVFSALLSFVSGGVLIQSMAKQFGALVISGIIYTIGTVILCVHLAFSEIAGQIPGMAFPGWWLVMLLLFSGVVATAIGNMVWNRALIEIGAARSAMYQYWIPVFGVLFAILLLDEPFSAWHAVGLVAILLGTYLGTRR